jgi:hypothetical protein
VKAAYGSSTVGIGALGHHGSTAAVGATDEEEKDVPSSLCPYDVLCGRSTLALSSVGNRRFRITVALADGPPPSTRSSPPFKGTEDGSCGGGRIRAGSSSTASRPGRRSATPCANWPRHLPLPRPPRGSPAPTTAPPTGSYIHRRSYSIMAEEARPRPPRSPTFHRRGRRRRRLGRRLGDGTTADRVPPGAERWTLASPANTGPSSLQGRPAAVAAAATASTTTTIIFSTKKRSSAGSGIGSRRPPHRGSL